MPELSVADISWSEDELALHQIYIDTVEEMISAHSFEGDFDTQMKTLDLLISKSFNDDDNIQRCKIYSKYNKITKCVETYVLISLLDIGRPFTFMSTINPNIPDSDVVQ